MIEAILQGVFSFAIFFVALFFGVIPFFIFHKLSNTDGLKDRILGLANAFAGGLFLSTGFVHLLGEATELMESEYPDIHYPLTELLCALGWMGTFILEKVFFKNYDVHTHDECDDEKETLIKKKQDNEKSSIISLDESISETEYSLDIQKTPISFHSDFAPYILLIVLCIHSFLSGIALGVQTSKSGIVSIGIAILSHKWIESIAVGVSLLKMSVPHRRYFILMFLYSLAEPSGILLGSLTQYFISEGDSLIVETFIGSLASGTFIYVATIDILAEEFSGKNDLYGKSFLMLFSFGIMSALPLVLHED